MYSAGVALFFRECHTTRWPHVWRCSATCILREELIYVIFGVVGMISPLLPIGKNFKIGRRRSENRSWRRRRSIDTVYPGTR